MSRHREALAPVRKETSEMNNTFARLAALGALTVACVVAAATVAAAPSLPVQQIIDRNVAARGGLDAWRRVTTLAMSGQMDANKPRALRPDYHPPAVMPKNKPVAGAVDPGAKPADDPNKIIELPYRLEMKRPRKTRLEVDFQNQTAVQIYDGSQGVKIRPFLGRTNPEAYTPAELELAAQEQELDGPLVDYARKGTKVALEGVEALEGRDTYKLKLTMTNGAVRRVWVDATSFLDVKIDGTRKLDGKQHAMSTYLRDYKSVDGLMMPMLSETTIDGVPGSTKLTVAKVTVNPPLDDSRFKVPTPTGAVVPTRSHP
ncbi:MAG: putative signal peptide protein [Gammaproteobacteria bacterium]|nr:putative signal peptide protein [Gammaproteobacteria bacterium]